MPATAGQVAFAFALGAAPSLVRVEPVGRPTMPSLRTRLAFGPRSIVVAVSRSRDGMAVRLDAEQDGPGTWAIGLDVRVRPVLAATIQSDSPERLYWALSARAPGGDPGEFFAYALRWATRKLAGESRARGRLLGVEAALRPVLRRAASLTASALEPALRAAAHRFAPWTRSRVASALSRDPRGWLREGARAHPGIVLFALALFGVEETEEAGLTLLHDLAEGRRLAPAVDAAVGAWAAALSTWAGQLDLWTPQSRGAFMAAAELVGDPRARMLAAQKVLVRRAGPWCDPGDLLIPPPLRFAPEDVPPSPRANAAWFRVMKVPRLTVAGQPVDVQPALALAFAAFASRHAVTLARVPRGVALHLWLRELREVLRASGRTPSRDSDPARIAARIDVEELRRKAAAPLPALVPLLRVREVESGAPVFAAADVVTWRVPGPAMTPHREAPCPPQQGTARPSVAISPPTFEPWTSAAASVVQLTTFARIARGRRTDAALRRGLPRDHRARRARSPVRACGWQPGHHRRCALAGGGGASRNGRGSQTGRSAAGRSKRSVPGSRRTESAIRGP